MSVIRFHEKAGRSQVNSFVFLLNKVFSPAEWPLSPCFHPHSRGANRFARCMLGVLVSTGAAVCLSPYGSALGEWNGVLAQCASKVQVLSSCPLNSLRASMLGLSLEG
jgi:hypothetical protein